MAEICICKFVEQLGKVEITWQLRYKIRLDEPHGSRLGGNGVVGLLKNYEQEN